MKYLIFDAGPIISLTLNGMLSVIEKLNGAYPDITFILTGDVKREVVDKPLKIRKFKLEALQVQDMIDRGVFTMSNKIVSDQKLVREMKKIERAANGVLRATETGEKIKIIHGGEISCLAFAGLVKGENLIVIDERTTRMLSEAPDRLENMMESKLHTPLSSNLDLIDGWKNFKFIRSAELLYVAWKKDLVLGKRVKEKGIGKRDKELLDALLYGAKFKGCAISSVEIEDLKRLAALDIGN